MNAAMRTITVYDRRNDGWRYVETVEAKAETTVCHCKRCAKRRDRQNAAVLTENDAKIDKI